MDSEWVAMSSNKEAYMVSTIIRTLTVSVMGKDVELPLKDSADGCIGVSLWFDTLENAVAYAGDGDEIKKATYEPKRIGRK